VYVKLEFMNPGGAIKDRMALHIVNKAEKDGRLQPGGTIIENTSGNTGFGLAMIAAVRGYKTIFTMPDKMSSEKVNRLKGMGSQVVVTPTNVAADDPRSYYETAKRLVKETPGSFYPNQYHTPDNIEAHYLSTGPEVWNQMDGKFDYFVAGLGTGGTMSGAGKYFKEKNPKVQNVGVDPIGSIYAGYFKTGKIGEAHTYKVEGIGGSEAFAKGSRPWLGQLNAFHNFRDGDNQVSLGGEEFQEVVCLFVSDKENLPAKVLLKSAEEGF
jgi:cystathionine beta-synthase